MQHVQGFEKHFIQLKTKSNIEPRFPIKLDN